MQTPTAHHVLIALSFVFLPLSVVMAGTTTTTIFSFVTMSLTMVSTKIVPMTSTFFGESSSRESITQLNQHKTIDVDVPYRDSSSPPLSPSMNSQYQTTTTTPSLVDTVLSLLILFVSTLWIGSVILSIYSFQLLC